MKKIITYLKDNWISITVLLLFLGTLITAILNNLGKEFNVAIFVIIGGSIGITLSYKAIQNYQFLKKVENTVTSKIRSVAIGLVEVRGKTIIKDELISPLNRERCIGYEISYDIESNTPFVVGYSVKEHSGKDHKTNDFYLEDETGRILVKAKGEKITREYSKELKFRFYKTIIDSNGIEYFKRTEITEKNVLFGTKEQKKEMVEKINNMYKANVTDEITPETKKELLTLENFSKIYKPVYNEIKIIEDYVEEGKEVYVLGNVELDENGNKVIVKGKDKLFEISVNNELNARKIFKYKSIIYGIIGTCALIITIALLTGIIYLVESGPRTWSIKIQLIGMLL